MPLQTANPTGLFLLAALLAGGVARIALGLLLGFLGGHLRCSLFLFPGDARRFGCRRFSGQPLFLGLRRVARFLGFGSIGGNRRSFGLTLLHRRIVGARTGAKLVQNPLPGLRCSLLPIGVIGFLESAHMDRVVSINSGVDRHSPALGASLSEPEEKYQRPREMAEQGPRS